MDVNLLDQIILKPDIPLYLNFLHLNVIARAHGTKASNGIIAFTNANI